MVLQALSHREFRIDSIAWWQRDHAGASRAYQLATLIAPRHADAYNNLGNALRDAGDVQGAVRALEAAIRAEPENAAALCNLGSLRTEMGRYVGGGGVAWPYPHTRPSHARECGGGVGVAWPERVVVVVWCGVGLENVVVVVRGGLIPI
jgi:tetratricopeptide (TPR) repeat protein